MVKAEANRLTPEEGIKMLACEIAMRAVFDVKLLKRRKVLIGDRIAPIDQRPKLTDCQCYRDDENIKNLLDDFRNGSVLFWCRMAGVNVRQSVLNQMLKENDNGIPEILQ